MRVRAVPPALLRDCAHESWVDTSRRPFVWEGTAWVPVKPGFPCDCDLPARRLYTGPGYYMAGDCAVLHGQHPGEGPLQALLRHTRARSVVLVTSADGPMRIPRAEVLAGEEAGVVSHREDGITYRFDPTRVIFSAGNRSEKARIAGLVRPGERVADMFAGIGYFTFPLARMGAKVHAMEINPVACGYLRANVEENGFPDHVAVDEGDCRTLIRGTYDRIVMGHFDSPGFLADALAHLRPGGTVHVHTCGACPSDLSPLLAGAGVRAQVTCRKVKKCGPGKIHYVHDVVTE